MKGYRERSARARKAIDQAFVRIGVTQGVAEDVIRSVLDGLPSAAGPLNHLLHAATACLPLLPDDGEPVVAAAADLHLDTLWSGELARCIAASPMLQDEAASPPKTPPPGGIDPMYYPKEAHAAFDQGLLLKCESASADLIVLWKRADRIAVMHAHPEGFWEVAPDPASWITELAEVLETGNSRGLIQWHIRRFVEASGVDRFCIVTADPAQGSREVDDGLRAHQLNADRVLARKKQGRTVWIDVASSVRARGQRPAEPQPILATAAAEIKAQLQHAITASEARTFSLTVGGQTRTRLKPRKLLKKVSTIAAARKKGHSAAVTAEQDPSAGPLPEPLQL